MDLFEYMGEKQKEKESPLASRMRPQILEDVARAAAHYRTRQAAIPCN